MASVRKLLCDEHWCVRSRALEMIQAEECLAGEADEAPSETQYMAGGAERMITWRVWSSCCEEWE